VFGELTTRSVAGSNIGRVALLWHKRVQYSVAMLALLGVGFLCARMLTRGFFLGADSANDYAHVWYISDQIFHHGRLPLHVTYLESGHALTFPYAIAPWIIASLPYAIIGDRAVTATMVAGFVLYGYAATRARPSLCDPRLLAIIYANTFLIEGLVSFQMAFIWSCGFFFLFVEAVDRRRWPLSAALAVLAITTHPFAGAACVSGYGVYALVVRRRDAIPLLPALLAVAIVVAPFALYIRTAPSAGSTDTHDLFVTLRWIARYRGAVVLLPLAVSAFAPAFRALFLIVFATMALSFGDRLSDKKVDTLGLTTASRPFFGTFLASPQFNRGLQYRVLEPNDREDGAYQLMRSRTVLTQEFFDQSQFRVWWNTPEQYACFLGAKHIDVVLLERSYRTKFYQNEDILLRDFQNEGKAHVVFMDRDPDGQGPLFIAYDVRGARQDGVRLSDCKL
jgi:hypothetical protein